MNSFWKASACRPRPPDAAVHKASRLSVDGLNIDSTYLNLLQESAAVSARPLSALLPRRVLIIQLDDNYCLLQRSSSVAAV